jgi:hypothetical protein
MLRRLLLIFAAAGLAVANAKTYGIDLFEPVMFGHTELGAGHYEVQVMGEKAVIRAGKTHCEATVEMENSDTRYNRTAVLLSNEGGAQKHILEIHVGGSKTKLVFKE